MTPINQANQLFQQGEFNKAEQIYRQLLQGNPQDINALWGLGKVALAFDSYQHAYDIFKKCTQLLPSEPELWLSLAQACQKLTRFEQAQGALLRAYQLNKEYLPSLLALAIHFSEAGEANEAESYLRATLSLNPEHVQAFCLLVRINRLTFDSSLSQLMLSKLTDADVQLSLSNKIALHYAFFTLLHKIKHYEQAFLHLKEANELQSSLIDFTVDDMKPFFDNLITSFDEQTLAKCDSAKSKNELIPIFIVGQPRSGSTLLEQMLLGHKDISSGGELPFLAGDIAQGIWKITGQHFPEGCRHLSEQDCRSLGDHYLKNMQSLAPNAKYIIDKMPANFQSIGLIKILMPQAKIIHIRRDVIDVTWSIYQNDFAAPEPYFCSLTEIVDYHHCYQQVMKHWQQLIPDFIHNVEYFKLVSEPKEEITKILSFCGLSYQNECLEFSKKKRHITTLSDIQLRDGIKKNQTGAWQPYEKHLSALLNRI